jgi:ankyrin repeat protein
MSSIQGSSNDGIVGWFRSLSFTTVPTSENECFISIDRATTSLVDALSEIDKKPVVDRQTAVRFLTSKMIHGYVQNGADVNATNDKLETALHLAAKLNRSDLVTTLLFYGAKPDAQDENGYTPLHRTAYIGNLRIVEQLLDYKANPNIKCETLTRGALALHLACQSGHFEVVKKLFPVTEEPQATTSDGYSALHFAAASGSKEIGTYLLEQSAFNLSAKTADGYTPLSIAIHYKKSDFASFLTQKITA